MTGTVEHGVVRDRSVDHVHGARRSRGGGAVADPAGEDGVRVGRRCQDDALAVIGPRDSRRSALDRAIAARAANDAPSRAQLLHHERAGPAATLRTFRRRGGCEEDESREDEDEGQEARSRQGCPR